MRSALLVFASVLLLSCSDPEQDPSEAQLDPSGPYGDCSDSCDGPRWSWDLAEGIGCICTPPCAVDSDCPEIEGLAPTCSLQEDPDPGRCVIDCEQDADCPPGLACQAVAGCLWPQP